MADPARARRLAKRIAKIVASGLEHEVKDPRLTMVTITDVKVTGDLRDATVYYTVLGETVDAPPDTAGAAAALASATGVLRSLVGRATGVRTAQSAQSREARSRGRHTPLSPPFTPNSHARGRAPSRPRPRERRCPRPSCRR